MRGKAMKGAAGRKAGVPHKGKSTGKREEVEESRGRRSSMPHEGKGAARGVEKEFVGGFEEKSRMVL